MDAEMDESIELDLNEFIDDGDIEMEDDELGKELKEIEKEENSGKTSLSEITTNENISNDTPTDENKRSSSGGRKSNHKNHRNRKTDFKTFCDEIDAKERDRKRHESDRSSNDRYENERYSNDRYRKHRHQDSKIDYKRLERSLHVNRNSDPMIVGREIAYRLHEMKTALFGHIVRILGFNMVSEIFAETKDLLRRGGIKTDSGDRKRTPGGTFIYIMKNRCYATPEQVKEIFKEDAKASKEYKKRKSRQESNNEKAVNNEKENITDEIKEDESKVDKEDIKEDVNKRQECNSKVNVNSDSAKKSNSKNQLEEGELSEEESGEITGESATEFVT